MGYLYGILSVMAFFVLAFSFFFLDFLPRLDKNLNIRLHSSFNCKIIMFLCKYSPQVAGLFQTYITIDRFVRVKYCNRFGFASKRWFINIILWLMLIILALINISTFFYYVVPIDLAKFDDDQFFYNETYSVVSNETNSSEVLISSMVCTTYPVLALVGETISTFLITWIPLSLMTLFNFFMLKIYYNSRLNLKVDCHLRRKEKELTLSVYYLSLLFFVTHTPIALSWLTKNIYYSVSNPSYSTHYYINFAVKISYSIGISYYGTFFFINIAFNRLFRKEILTFMKSKQKPHQNRRK